MSLTLCDFLVGALEQDIDRDNHIPLRLGEEYDLINLLSWQMLGESAKQGWKVPRNSKTVRKTAAAVIDAIQAPGSGADGKLSMFLF